MSNKYELLDVINQLESLDYKIYYNRLRKHKFKDNFYFYFIFLYLYYLRLFHLYNVYYCILHKYAMSRDVQNIIFIKQSKIMIIIKIRN